MSRFIPRFETCRWGGSHPDGETDVDGWCLVFSWGGLVIEIAGGTRGAHERRYGHLRSGKA